MYDDIDHYIVREEKAKGALTGSEVRLKLKKEDYNIRIFLHHPPTLSTSAPPVWGTCSSSFCSGLIFFKAKFYLELEQQLFVLVLLQARLLFKIVFPVLVHLLEKW